MKQFQCKIILIAPQWPRRHCFTQLLQLCIAQPIRLPCIPNLLRQPKTAIYHPKPEIFNLNAWFSVDRQFRTQGFSNNVRKLLSESWRASTHRDYGCKFKQFNSWCDQRQIDTYSATLVQCKEFFANLYNKGLQYRTIAGYRSMLSAVLPTINNMPVGQHPNIIRITEFLIPDHL